MTKVSTPSAVRPSSWAPDQVSRTASPLTVTDSWRAFESGQVGEERLEEGVAALVPYVYLVGLHEAGVSRVVGGDKRRSRRTGPRPNVVERPLRG